jgi:hypothetical protein
MDHHKVARPKRSKKLVTIFAAIIVTCGFVGGAVYYTMHKQPSVFSEAYVQSKIKFNTSEKNCNNHIEELKAIDLSKMSSLDAAKVANQRATCYFILDRYKEALHEYQTMQKLCNKQTQDFRCKQAADAGVGVAKEMTNTPQGRQIQ